MSRSIRSSIPSFVLHSAQSEAWIFACCRLQAALLCISETRKMDTNQWGVGTLSRHTYQNQKESDFVVVATRKRIALSRTRVLHREPPEHDDPAGGHRRILRRGDRGVRRSSRAHSILWEHWQTQSIRTERWQFAENGNGDHAGYHQKSR